MKKYCGVKSMKTAVVGSGSWGTALALCLLNNGHNVTLWSHNPQKAEEISKSRINPSLKDVLLPDTLEVTANPSCVSGCDMVVIASPSFAIRSICNSIKTFLRPDTVVVSVTKGIENNTLMRMSEIIKEETGIDAVVLTGPSHAEEVSRGIPTACVAACEDKNKAELVQNAFMSDTFRIYTTPDVVGAELGGAIKNVIALCAGVIDGVGCGDNTKAMLITRGLTEMARLGVSMGASKETFAGLAGVGDLTVTCTSRHSRNCRAGVLIGQGMPISKVISESHGVVEGYYATKSVYSLAKRNSVDMPIVNAAYSVLYDGVSADSVIELLMKRTRKAESEDVGWN